MNKSEIKPEREPAPTTRLGFVHAGSSEYLVHRRRGRVRRQGRGISILVLPWIDHVVRIPLAAQTLGFTADQITAENQGVEVSGLAIWRIAEPERTMQHFDFAPGAQPLERIGAALRDVVEAAVRVQVARLELETVLRERGGLVARLKQDVYALAEEWGLAIATVELRNVRVMSAPLFAHMQARHRDAMRLASERSALEAEQSIARARAEAREELAAQEHAAQLRACELACALAPRDREVEEARASVERLRREHTRELGLIEDELARHRLETANLESPALVLLRALPALAASLRVGELNLTGDVLRAGLTEVATLLSRPGKRLA